MCMASLLALGDAAARGGIRAVMPVEGSIGMEGGKSSLGG